VIDVIIPAYNAHKTISQSLASLAIQTIKDKCKVYIVDDCSEKNYDIEIKPFDGILNIEQLKTEKNSGAGYARQYGIDHSSSDFIVFLDSDDLLHDCFALRRLYDAINDSDSDLVAGAYINEGENPGSSYIVKDDSVFGCLHGKIYRRKYLVDNNIRFNRTRYSEDNSFGGIVVNTTNKVLTISDVVYVYRYNNSSLTSDKQKLVRIHTSYLHNMLWLARELKKRNVNQNNINGVMLNSYVYMFHEVFTHQDVDFSKMFYQCYMFEEFFKSIEDTISPELIRTYIGVHFNGDDIYISSMVRGFEEFRKAFRKR